MLEISCYGSYYFNINIDVEQILLVSNNNGILLQGQNENVNMGACVNDVCGKVSKILVSAIENSGLIISKIIYNTK